MDNLRKIEFLKNMKYDPELEKRIAEQLQVGRFLCDALPRDWQSEEGRGVSVLVILEEGGPKKARIFFSQEDLNEAAAYSPALNVIPPGGMRYQDIGGELYVDGQDGEKFRGRVFIGDVGWPIGVIVIENEYGKYYNLQLVEKGGERNLVLRPAKEFNFMPVRQEPVRPVAGEEPLGSSQRKARGGEPCGVFLRRLLGRICNR